MSRVNRSQPSMLEGSIWKGLIFFALPILLGNLFQQLYNTADTLIVGNFIGKEALAAVSSSGNLIQLMIGLLQGTAMGAGILIAKHFGAKDREQLHSLCDLLLQGRLDSQFRPSGRKNRVSSAFKHWRL